MKGLEEALRIERESYEREQVPEQFKRKVEGILANLPEQKRSLPVWPRRLMAAAAVLFIICSMIHFKVPGKMEGILKEAFNNLPRKAPEGNKQEIRKGALVEGENIYHPVVFVNYRSEKGEVSKAQVLGGSKDGRWFGITDFNISGKYTTDEDFQKPMEKDFINYVDLDLIKGNEFYNFYSNTKLVGKSNGGKGVFSIPQSNSQRLLEVKIDSFKADEDFLIGINGQWNGIPRVPAGLRTPNGFSVDLDNDGTEESIYPELENGKGRVIIDKRGDKILIQQVDKVHVDDIKGLKIRLLDINGDGNMEIIIKESFYYGTIINAYELVNNQVKKVLQFSNCE